MRYTRISATNVFLVMLGPKHLESQMYFLLKMWCALCTDILGCQINSQILGRTKLGWKITSSQSAISFITGINLSWHTRNLFLYRAVYLHVCN
jgi:hypothetical protein